MCASERHISFTFSDYSTFHTKYNPYSLSKTINRHIIHILLLNYAKVKSKSRKN